MKQRPFVIALSGGIASGKSALGERLIAHGLPLFDADIASREAVEPGQPALTAIVERFGPEMLQADGRLDRRALRLRVFGEGADPSDRGRRRGDRHATAVPGIAHGPYRRRRR